MILYLSSLNKSAPIDNCYVIIYSFLCVLLYNFQWGIVINGIYWQQCLNYKNNFKYIFMLNAIETVIERVKGRLYVRPTQNRLYTVKKSSLQAV